MRNRESKIVQFSKGYRSNEQYNNLYHIRPCPNIFKFIIIIKRWILTCMIFLNCLGQNKQLKKKTPKAIIVQLILNTTQFLIICCLIISTWLNLFCIGCIVRDFRKFNFIYIYIVYMSWSRICFMSICNKRVCSINLCCYNCWSSIGLITTLWKTTWDIYWIKVSSSSSVDSLISHLLVQEEQIYIGHTFDFNSSMI